MEFLPFLLDFLPMLGRQALNIICVVVRTSCSCLSVMRSLSLSPQAALVNLSSYKSDLFNLNLGVHNHNHNTTKNARRRRGSDAGDDKKGDEWRREKEEGERERQGGEEESPLERNFERNYSSLKESVLQLYTDWEDVFQR